MDFKKRMSGLHKIALFVLAAACSDVFAIDLGSIRVQSGLNQALHVSIPVLGTDVSNIRELCPKGKIQSVDGVLLARPQINFAGDTQPSALVITTTQAINESVVSINIEVGCGTSIRRNYQILLDAVATLPAAENVQAITQPEAHAKQGKDAKVRGAHKSKRNKAASTEQDVKEPSAEKKSVLPTHLHGKKVSRNVLRLSADVSPVESSSMLNGMKLSDILTVEGFDTDPQKAVELREAQMRFAAIMRGEDPEQNAENETKAAQDKIQVLMKEADQIRQQSEQDRRAFEEEQKKSLNINWFMGLGALLLACLIAIAWLARRLHQVNKMSQLPFWDPYYSEGNTGNDDSPLSDAAADLDNTSSLSDENMSTISVETDHSENKAFKKPAGDRMQGTSKESGAKAPATDKSAESSAEIVPLPKSSSTMRNRKRSGMIEVKEISDVMEEAVFWMSSRDPQRAISVLEQFGDIERPKSPMVWLYLLMLYREVGDRSRFETLHQRFKSHFNTKVPEWDAKADEMHAKGLEYYPHLVKQICILWESDQAARYLEDLIFDNRNGQREVFDLSAYLDLIMLANIAYEVFPSSRNGKLVTVSHI